MSIYNKKIFKYPIPISDYSFIDLPEHAHILSVKIQNKVMCLWALVDPSNKLVKHHFKVVGTGHDTDIDMTKDTHLSTIIDGPYVWHVFEVSEPKLENRLTEHIPGFAYNGEERRSWKFNTLEELLELEYVKKFKEDNKYFMLSENRLMIVSASGDWWWVVGYLQDKIDLPEWKQG